MLSVDDRLWRTLEEVARLEEESRLGDGAAPAGSPTSIELAPEAPASSAGTESVARKGPRSSRLTPKEIQAQLRAGRTVQEVARIAETEISWIERFVGPILAERKGIVEAVKAGVISRPRRGRSGTPVGRAIVANLKERRINLSNEAMDDGWRATRRNGEWEVAFRYTVRGQVKEAQFAFDVDSRAVRPVNPMASQIGWRAPETPVIEEAPEPEPSPPLPRPAPSLTARATPTGPRRPGARGAASPAQAPTSQAPRAQPGAGGARGARRSGAPGAGDDDAFSPPSGRASSDRSQTSPRGAGAADERPSYARRSSSSRPRRLVSEDDEAWKAALSRSRAGKEASRTAEQTAEPRKARPVKKRLPDDWLLEP